MILEFWKLSAAEALMPVHNLSHVFYATRVFQILDQRARFAALHDALSCITQTPQAEEYQPEVEAKCYHRILHIGSTVASGIYLQDLAQ